jgi:hypothetical protein
MAEILTQEGVDKQISQLVHFENARDKIISNYYELTSLPCIYDLEKRSELMLCLNELIVLKPKKALLKEFLKQCQYIKDRLNGKAGSYAKYTNKYIRV